jgi:hypothetical protein
MCDMIRWKRSFQYFLNKAEQNNRAYYYEVEDFVYTYNCTMLTTNVMECSEEDFLIIKLTCPEAVRCVI